MWLSLILTSFFLNLKISIFHTNVHSLLFPLEGEISKKVFLQNMWYNLPEWDKPSSRVFVKFV